MSEDLKPEPPVPPEPGDCCHSGCTYCVEDLYQEELDRYREALKTWEARNAPHPGPNAVKLSRISPRHSHESGNP